METTVGPTKHTKARKENEPHLETHHYSSPSENCVGFCGEVFWRWLRACPKIARGPAARDFGCGQGGEVRASPTRAVRTEPTQATDKRPAARRVFAPKAAWLRCSSVEDPGRIFSFVAPRHPAFGAKTGPRGIFGHALRRNEARKRNRPSPPGRGGAWPAAALLVGHSPKTGMLPPRALHPARRRSRQNRKLFLHRP